jgi:hypothetical protein
VKNWKSRVATLEAKTGTLRYFDSDGIDTAKLKGGGVVTAMRSIEDRPGKRPNRFNITIQQEGGSTRELEVCTTTALEKENWMGAEFPRVPGPAE